MSEVRVQFLGTGSPFANGGRLQSCILVEGDGVRLLLDCGATSLVALARAGIDPGTLDAVLLTHLHGDHVGGVPFLILESLFNAREGSGYPPRERPLRVAGPAETEEHVRELMRWSRYGPYFAQARERALVEFLALEPGRRTEVGALAATAFPVRHTPEATALRIELGGRTIAYSGDTGWTETLVEAAAGADLFICQTYSFAMPEERMLSYRVLMEHRARLRCKRLILTHIGPDMQRHLAEVEEEVAEDGAVLLV